MITHITLTDKKENILITALELFANDGYNSTSTANIAKRAGVSEGLIFRHFESKKGLLDAIMRDAERRLQEIFAVLIFETDPIKVLRKYIELPFSMPEDQYSYWKLQFKLKWDNEYYRPEKMKPVSEKLTWAFSALNYEQPELEAQLMMQCIDSIAIAILMGGMDAQVALKGLLIQKYIP